MPIPLNLYKRINPRRVKAAKQHLDLAFGDSITDQRKDEIISNSLLHFLTLPMSSWVTSKWSYYELCESIKISDCSLNNLHNAIDQQKGVFALSCHLGHFEFAIKYFSNVLPNELSILTKRFSPACLNDIIQNRRRQMAKIIYKEGAAKNVYKAIKQKETVAILMDQNRPDGVFVPFFNRLAGTSPLAATISAKLGALILPLACVSDGDGRYELIINKAFVCGGEGDKKSIIEEGTKRCNAEMEKIILQFPDQYLWTHMRYKACAPGQAPLYPPK